MRDMITILKEWDIPYCVWNYLSTPNDGNKFSLVDDDTRDFLPPIPADKLRFFLIHLKPHRFQQRFRLDIGGIEILITGKGDIIAITGIGDPPPTAP